ncbi:acyl-CoA-binding protein-like [Tropilaelaps mercedesae]|uniref:Acyl-CoA-binding protein-like n=1 Tax=Tropilaelaps mercedesae TaxID=418985 RepID=A0A1V9X1F1_9ACAR|nr:acyl-CoA-binding protein-like [Tropilaelaps mercedesae]
MKTRPSDDELLQLYGLYKQATVGDVTGEAPGILDLKGKAKYNAWTGRKGLSKGDAKQQYCKLAKELIAKANADKLTPIFWHGEPHQVAYRVPRSLLCLNGATSLSRTLGAELEPQCRYWFKSDILRRRPDL